MKRAARILPPHVRSRLVELHERYRRAFWILHSVWALATGVLVLVLSHEKWGLAGWVMVFLGITWASTLFFTRLARRLPDSPAARMGKGFVSYVTRVMYQETLFFLLPFYYSSATPWSINLLFVLLLAALAVLACLDLVFDDLLRRRPWFGLLFFAVVTFASLNFLLPVLFSLRLELATPIAAAGGLAAALPLAWTGSSWRRPQALAQLGVGLALAVLLAVPGRAILPPVPLRIESLEWAPSVDRETVRATSTLGDEASVGDLSSGQLAIVARVFAPRRLAASVVVVWARDGAELRRSRTLEITPHRLGFSVWHAWRPVEGPFPAGRYEVEIETVDGRLIGRSRLHVRPGG